MKGKHYNIDTGLYPTYVKLCFNQKGFYAVLDEFNIPQTMLQQAPLQMGSVAETHTFNNAGNMVVILIIDISQREEDAAALAGTVAHECCHIIDSILEHIGEPKEEFGPESRAYLMQHLVDQIFFQCIVECVNAERKATRAAARKKGKGQGGTVPQVGKSGDDRGAGPVGDLPIKDDPRRDEGPKGKAIPPPRVHDKDAGTARDSRTRTGELRSDPTIH